MSSVSDCASAEAAAATLWCHETVADSAAAPVVPEGLRLHLLERNATGYKGVAAITLVDAGYDDVQFLLEMSDDKIETILTEAGMAKVGHRKRFVSCVRKLRAAAA